MLAYALLGILSSLADGTFNRCEDGTYRRKCERYRCDVELSPHTAEEFIPHPGRSVFSQPCRCQENWNELFCRQANEIINLPLKTIISFPTVCICRQFIDHGRKCNQFITRCYKRGNKCGCCFNQPENHCEHIRCHNNEPVFSGANTTCTCFSNPVDYPTQICHGYQFQRRPQEEYIVQTSLVPLSITTSSAVEAKLERDKIKSTIPIIGVQVSATLVFVVVVVLLGIVAILTVLGLVAGNRRMRLRREERHNRMTQANVTLMTRRTEDETYLP